jgi:hypothetical protein
VVDEFVEYNESEGLERRGDEARDCVAIFRLVGISGVLIE